jgi:hypothetical protein
LHDLRYTDIQSSLLAYLLPFCLELWCEDLRGTREKYGGFVEHLYPVLADRAIFDNARNRLLQFFQESFKADDSMIDTIGLVSGNPEPMHEALRDVMSSLRVLDFAVPGCRTGR